MNEIILKGRLNGRQRLRLEKLLDMLYMPGELAREIGFTRRQVYRVYVHLGMPHSRDDRKHLWINGREFRAWYEATYPRVTLGAGEGFCLSCKRPMQLAKARREKRAGFVYWVGYCPKCGRKIPRIISNDKRGK